MWIYVPTSASCPSAPAEADSILASDWRLKALASSLTWRETHSPAGIWSRRCKTVSWLRHLCGAMSEPSTAALGVAAFIASLPVIPASHSPRLEDAPENETLATYGPMSAGLSSRHDRSAFFSKMSGGILRSDSTLFGESYRDFASRLRQDYSRRRRLVRRTSASGFSPSRWLTPDVPNGGRSLTADASPTGVMPDGSKKQVGLANQARMWPTPAARDFRSGGDRRRRTNGPMLTDAILTWATPRAAMSRALSNSKHIGVNGRGKGNLEDQTAAFLSSLPDQMTAEHGAPSSIERRILNPLFVEWLMGWPPGWTSFACSETALSLWRQRMRSELSTLAIANASPEPQQLSLV